MSEFIQHTTSLNGVFAVPPLTRQQGKKREIHFEENARLVRHMVQGGISRFIYGGNAFLYHVTLAEYEELLRWLSEMQSDELWFIPSAGPSYGRLMDQAPLLRQFAPPCVMVLPCSDPRDAAGIEQGIREFAKAADVKLMLYLKDESNMGSDREAGLDVVRRLVADGICMAIKYAVVRREPETDAYLAGLLERVDRSKVISGMGERPAVTHLRDWKLTGFTTGSGCLVPRLSSDLLAACQAGHFAEAEEIRTQFLGLEDIRDAWGPARVLHQAVELAEIAETGPIPPFVSALSTAQQIELKAAVERMLGARVEPGRVFSEPVFTGP